MCVMLPRARGASYRKRVSIYKLCCNAVYYKNSLILLVNNMLCSKLPYQRFSIRIEFSNKMTSVSWCCAPEKD